MNEQEYQAETDTQTYLGAEDVKGEIQDWRVKQGLEEAPLEEPECKVCPEFEKIDNRFLDTIKRIKRILWVRN